MRLLLTNDDGIGADGLVALRAAAEPFGPITVVAPEVSHSGCSHSVTYKGVVRVTAVTDPRLGQAYACDGTPADCVRLALTAMNLGPFDWVLAGVNAGANLGVDVFYSGTIAAVREAAILGCRGIAVSQFVRPSVPPDWELVTARVRHLLSQLLEQPDANPMTWSINLPTSEAGPPGLRVAALSHDAHPMEYEKVNAGDAAAQVYRYCGVYPERVAKPGTDVDAVFSDNISLTPMNLDGTDTSGLERSFTPPGV